MRSGQVAGIMEALTCRGGIRLSVRPGGGGWRVEVRASGWNNGRKWSPITSNCKGIPLLMEALLTRRGRRVRVSSRCSWPRPGLLEATIVAIVTTREREEMRGGTCQRCVCVVGVPTRRPCYVQCRSKKGGGMRIRVGPIESGRPPGLGFRLDGLGVGIRG